MIDELLLHKLPEKHTEVCEATDVETFKDPEHIRLRIFNLAANGAVM